MSILFLSDTLETLWKCLTDRAAIRSEFKPGEWRSGPGGLPVGGRKQVGFGFFFWQLGTDRSYTRAGSKDWVELQPGRVFREGFP